MRTMTPNLGQTANVDAVGATNPSAPSKPTLRVFRVLTLCLTLLCLLQSFCSGNISLADERPTKRLVLDGPTMQAKLTHYVKPVYPPEAKENNIHGIVRLRIIVGTDGVVKFLEVLSGHPALARAALDAVRQWRYEPTTLNGQPIEVVTGINVRF